MAPVEINTSTRLFGLIGTSVHHSYSPLIHNTAFRQLKINAYYLALNVAKGRVGEAVRGMRALGFGGFNVTFPHKESVMAYLDRVSDEARLIRSVNTAVQRKGKWIGYNTDVAGFTRSMEKYRSELKNKKILIVGAGGAARAAAYALIKYFGAKDIVISNRSKARAEKFIRDFRKNFSQTHLTFLPLGAIRGEFKLIINATPVGLRSEKPLVKKSLFHAEMIAYDLIYNPSETVFLKQAHHEGATAINGLDMLIEQASASFELWTKESMPADMVRVRLNETFI